MKRCAFVMFIAVVMLAGSAAAEEPVYFADPNLKAAVEDALGTLDPTPSDMLGLTSLTCKNAGVKDLTGLKYAKNLA
jgi:hypothetical protein